MTDSFESSYLSCRFYRLNNPYVREGRQWILLRVKDHGCVIPELVESKILEPFYSTKSPEKRAESGLSINYGIVKDHQGYIEIQSDPGRSTTIDVHLPIDGGQIKVPNHSD